MANFYIYFISSLASLHFEQRPPFNFKRFLEMCAEFIPQEDFRILENLPQPKDFFYKDIREPVISRWVSYDTALRNELAKVRSMRGRIEASKYLRQQAFTEASLAQLAIAAHRNTLLIEAEKMLDRARWNFLDGLSFGHYFDLDFLIIYAYKLMILERWENFRVADKTALLEAALG
jgi:hypothetical protein